ncbi:hypothetical protein BH23VER1_BH23VER1_33710 [soil metagenome]
MELNEKWLQSAAGWQAVKQARQIHAAGAVVRASYDGSLLKGVLTYGGKERAAGMLIRSRTDVDNLCTCPTARRSGGLCEHSVALALQVILGAPAGAAEARGFPHGGARGGDNPPASAAAGDAVRGAPAAVPLRVELPPKLSSGWGKGSVAVRIARCDPTEDPTPEDGVLTTWLAEAGIPPAAGIPPILLLDRAQAASLFGALVGHPRISLAGAKNAEPFRISDLPFRRRVKVEAGSHQGVVLSAVPVPQATILLESPSPEPEWALIEGRNLLLPVVTAPDSLRFLNSSQSITKNHWWLALNSEQLENTFALEDPDGVLASLEIVRLAPQIQLHLEGSLLNLAAQIRFDYLGTEAKPGTKNPAPESDPRFPLEHPDRPGFFCVRNREAELAATARLAAAGFSDPDPHGTQHVSGERSILAFYGGMLQRLEREWTVTLGERFRGLASRVARVRPSVSIQGGSGEDWLTCTLDFSTSSGVTIPRDQIQQLLRGGGKGTIVLPDGRRAAIDTEAAHEFNEILRDCHPDQLDPGRFKMRGHHIAYLAESTQFFNGSLEHHTESPRKSEDLNITDKFIKVLRPYQREGVRWMLQAAYPKGGAILADEMGLGKTVQILALLDTLNEFRKSDDGRSLALVVCPTSLLENWRSEAARFAPDLRVRVMHGSDRLRHFADLPATADLALTSYGLLVRDIERYRQIPLAVAILDEASFIRNPDTKNAKAARALDADARLALTGTPVENSVADLWSIMRFVAPGYLGGRDEFRERFERPIAAAAQLAGGAPSSERRRLAWRMKPFLLRRLKSSVLTDLPAKIEQVVYCELDRIQAETYRRILEEGRENVRQALRQQGPARARTSMLTVLLRLRQVSCDLRLLDGLTAPAPAKAPAPSGKVQALAELLREAVEGGHRVLIFSQFVRMLGLLKAELDTLQIPFCYLDGSMPTSERTAQVTAFQAPRSHIGAFLISLKAGGYGLTLTAADTVIHFDPWWNPAVETQATDRAHRIGQKKVVSSYKLISRGTVEEKILNLQRQKRSLFDAAIDDHNPMMTGLQTPDLESLLDL